MVARRKKTSKRRSSRQKGFSIINGVETYMLLNVATNTLFNTNAVQFLTAKTAPHSGNITLQELISPSGRFYDRPDVAGVQGPGYYVMSNLKKNWMSGVMGMILIPIAFKAGKSITRPVISRTNRLLGKAGVANTVKL